MAEDSTEYMQTQLAERGLAEDAVPADAEPNAPVDAGGFIGRYRIRERIGEGGMGVVYAADDPDLGRTVAIKLLRPVEGSDGEVHQRRMLREAQALARVSHPNLVTVYDVGTHEGRVWIAMEYVVGETLDAWLGRTRRSWGEIVDVFIEAGRGLAAVHAAGLVHRDFKPGNVLVGAQGTVQVLDFGLAARTGERVPDEDGEGRARPDLDALAATLTTTGGIMGTPAYMAPEQFLRLGADARADQFAFCVALYEALYGRRPWKGRDLGELMVAVVGGLTERPPPLPGVPEEIRKVITRGLRADAEERYADMNALLAVLETARMPRQPPRSFGWGRIGLGMLLGGGVLALGARQWVVRDQPAEMPPEVEETIVANEDEVTEDEPVVVQDVAPAPAFAREDDDGEEPLEADTDADTDSDTNSDTDGALADLPGLEALEELADLGTGSDGHGLAGLPTLPDEPDEPDEPERDAEPELPRPEDAGPAQSPAELPRGGGAVDPGDEDEVEDHDEGEGGTGGA